MAKIVASGIAAITDNSGGAANAAAGIGATLATEVSPLFITLASLANSQVYSFDPGFNGYVKAISFRVRTAALTAGKAATLQAQANGVSTTGGAVALTTAACNAIGNQVAGSSITGANTFTSAQTIGFAVSGVTAFAEGDGFVQLTLVNTDLANSIATILVPLNSLA
jgi:hypothetical protein